MPLGDAVVTLKSVRLKLLFPEPPPPAADMLPATNVLLELLQIKTCPFAILAASTSFKSERFIFDAILAANNDALVAKVIESALAFVVIEMPVPATNVSVSSTVSAPTEV